VAPRSGRRGSDCARASPAAPSHRAPAGDAKGTASRKPRPASYQ
jgi:hypothetical protein